MASFLRRLPMEHYRGSQDNAGVVCFCPGPDWIVIEFKDGATYLYDQNRPGKRDVEIMKRLARAGEGLTTYINQHVRERYATRLKP